MIKRRINISIGFFLLMLLGISLSFSTLHSHHNLELHNSSDFADTGHCITADYILCPICAHLIQSDELSSEVTTTPFIVVNRISLSTEHSWTPQLYFPNKGRSPPVLG